ncbi:MAG: 6-carboxytetrahydropterin synthase [Alistipes sp.]|nr:6-carboxytetrahydropterin synthase [Alistipes sp.]
MNVIRLTKEFSFEASHLLEGYDGACSQIHGHSYRLFVTVKGTPNMDSSDPKYGMVMDFGALKKIVKELIVDKYDHSLVVRRTETNSAFLDSLKARFDRLVETDYQPTCENMLPRFAADLKKALPCGVDLFSLRLHETATSFAEWFEEDNR